MGEPFTRLWRQWESEQGPQKAACSLAQLLCTQVQQGKQRVRQALAQLNAQDEFVPLSLERLLTDQDPPTPVADPEALRGNVVKAASAADYARLLEAVVG